MRSSVKKTILYCLYCAAASYLIAELAYSTLYSKGVIGQQPQIYLIEDTGEPMTFDPIRGYRLSSTPSRQAQITFGEIEYIGVLRGNSQGFPDRDDFGPERTHPEAIRVAVFGDSFTATQYVDINWPDRVEDLAREAGPNLELLNFSVDGAGLANWWSILTGIVEAEHYEIDALVFAVMGYDLDRTFFIAGNSHAGAPAYCHVASWDPDAWPKTPEEARAYLTLPWGHFVPPETFDAALRGEWRPTRPWRFYVARKALGLAVRLAMGAGSLRACQALSEDPLDLDGVLVPGQRKLVEDIARYIRANRTPALVVFLPCRENLIEGVGGWPAEVDEFASILNAPIIDGHEAFAGLTEQEIRADWLPYDGHWGQGGSDKFAAFMFHTLRNWIQDFPRHNPG